MSPDYEGRLELTWTNKPLRLLAHEDGSYEWVHPADYRVAEVRLLHDVAEVGTVSKRRATDNLLIRGDALNALTSLARLPEFAREYLGKVKLVYIDPPFNTQQSFLHYDDALEHSVWLTMMRDRVLQIRDLLSADGSVWVHLDQSEVHYGKIVLDEVFGRANFVGEVIWRAADSSNHDAKQFSVDHNTILVYSREPGWRSVALERGEEHNAHYSNPDNDPRGAWFPGNVSSPNPRDNLRYEIDASFDWDGTAIEPPANGWRWQPDTMREKIDTGEVVLREDVSGKPRLLRKTYLADQSGLAPSSLWADIDETGHNRQAKYELKKLFPKKPTASLFKTPKPERLLARILHVATQPGDVVLDFFLGSGTTAAVALKYGRRWVGVEWSPDTIEEFALPRLERVVKGADAGGVTSLAGWKGGGGFRVLDVSSSMFEAQEGLVFLADWMTNGALAEATAAQLGFEFVSDPPFVGRKGRIRLAVVDGVVNESVVKLLARALPERERVVICGTGIDTDARPLLRELRPGSTLRKIPAALLDEYRSTRQLRLSLNAAEQLGQPVEVTS
ncbi:MAG TPA: site-specific DNA-methyltransferase [Candidatus Saccharimonadales bacterium]|nr:site-specific DNA-methyltransferase [Candidatus Saccharimonadales bacterium]